MHLLLAVPSLELKTPGWKLYTPYLHDFSCQQGPWSPVLPIVALAGCPEEEAGGKLVLGVGVVVVDLILI